MRYIKNKHTKEILYFSTMELSFVNRKINNKEEVLQFVRFYDENNLPLKISLKFHSPVVNAMLTKLYTNNGRIGKIFRKNNSEMTFADILVNKYFNKWFEFGDDKNYNKFRKRIDEISKNKEFINKIKNIKSKNLKRIEISYGDYGPCIIFILNYNGNKETLRNEYKYIESAFLTIITDYDDYIDLNYSIEFDGGNIEPEGVVIHEKIRKTEIDTEDYYCDWCGNSIKNKIYTCCICERKLCENHRMIKLNTFCTMHYDATLDKIERNINTFESLISEKKSVINYYEDKIDELSKKYNNRLHYIKIEYEFKKN